MYAAALALVYVVLVAITTLAAAMFDCRLVIFATVPTMLALAQIW